jgi:hypothetical protein
MTWWFKDGCDDNQSPTVGLFDKTSGATFGPYPLATFDAAVSAAINCTTGDNIYWGGWAASGKTWGCGQNRTVACNDRCFKCGDVLPTGWSLTCN